MANANDSAAPAGGGRDYFATTHWSVVVNAGQEHSPDAEQALAELCRTYWYPIYVYVRRQGHSPHDAEDLTQEFFTRLLARKALASANRDRGRFRCFLLGCLNHFLKDEWDKARAEKRGRDRLVPLEVSLGEDRLAFEPVDERTPEKIFDRAWAMTLLETVIVRLQHDYEQEGKKELFEALRFSLTGDHSSATYQQLGRQLGMTENSVKVAVHRMRERYRGRLRAEIAQTVIAAGDIDAEYQDLLCALA